VESPTRQLSCHPSVIRHLEMPENQLIDPLSEMKEQKVSYLQRKEQLEQILTCRIPAFEGQRKDREYARTEKVDLSP
jgi:hypothetical protein